MPTSVLPALPCYLDGEFTTLPVTRLDGRPAARPGPLHARLHAAYQDAQQAARQEGLQ